MSPQSSFSLISTPSQTTWDEPSEPPVPKPFRSEFIGTKTADLWAMYRHIQNDIVGPGPKTINTQMIAELDDKSTETDTVVLHYDYGEGLDQHPAKRDFRVPIKWVWIMIADETVGNFDEYLDTDKIDEDGVIDLPAIKGGVRGIELYKISE